MDSTTIRNERTAIETLKPSQVVCLASHVRSQILEHFVEHGPCSIIDVAGLMETYPEGLYHHLKKLLGEGLIREIGIRRRGSRDEMVYDAVARAYLLRPRPWDEEYVACCVKLHRVESKRAEAEHIAATETFGSTSLTDAYLYSRTLSFRLDDAKLSELREKLKEFDRWLVANNAPTGRPHSLFMAITPHNGDTPALSE